MTTVQAPAHHPESEVTRGDSYAWFVVIALAVVNLVASADRFMMGIIMVPLRTAMDLSDTQLGMVYGLGFAILYSAAGVPMGRLADAQNRRNMIIAGCFLWSVGTFTCAFADSFVKLLVARSFIGLGEAAMIPAAISLISAYIPRQGLGLANGVFFGGSTAGKAISFIGGGLLLSTLAATNGFTVAGVHFEPWQAVFLLATIPGLAAIAFVVLIREPARPRANKRAQPLGELLAYVAKHGRTYWLVTVGATCLQLCALTLAAWMPSFYVRRFDMDVAQAGVTVGLISAFVGIIGALLGGWVTDRIARAGVSGAPCILIGCSLLASIPVALVALVLASTSLSSAIAYAVLHGLILMGGPQCYAAMQQITPLAHRGLTTALQLALVMLVSLGFGPVLIGLLSDNVFAGQANALGYALVSIIIICGLFGAALLFAARSAFERTAIDAEAAVA